MFSGIERRPDVRAAVLRSEGRGFCGGGDLKEVQSLEGFAGILGQANGSYTASLALAECAVPVVAAVHQYCIGVGVLLAGAVDIVVSHADARFVLAEVDNGATGGAIQAVGLMPERRLRAAMFTCEPVLAAELAQYGGVYRLVDEDKVAPSRSMSPESSPPSHLAWSAPRRARSIVPSPATSGANTASSSATPTSSTCWERPPPRGRDSSMATAVVTRQCPEAPQPCSVRFRLERVWSPPEPRRKDGLPVPRPKVPLISKRKTLEAALRIIDAEGLESLSVRRLAIELNVNGASLYHHFKNKEEILVGAATSRSRTYVRLRVPATRTGGFGCCATATACGSRWSTIPT